MFITRKRFEEELEKARESGFNQAMEQVHEDDRFRKIENEICRLAAEIGQISHGKPVAGFGKEV